MKIKYIICMLFTAAVLQDGCKPKPSKEETSNATQFDVMNDKFADIQLLRYEVPGFENLSTKQKELVYYLYEAALSGRDIIYDQKYKYNLAIRKTIEAIYETYKGERTGEDWKKFETYAKRVWFSNGIHHHYSNMKFVPEFSREYYKKLVEGSEPMAFPYPVVGPGLTIMDQLQNIIFDPNIDPKIVDQSPGIDNIKASANNFYEGVTQAEVEAFYNKMADPNDTTQPEYGLNSKVVKENGQLAEKVWKVGGMYTQAIERIVYWLEKAVTVAENAQQKDALEKLIKYYKSGNVDDWDTYNLAWVKDDSRVDAVNGFIEVYLDAIGKKGSFESVVSIKDMEASKRIEAIGKEAKWFEDNSPIMAEHKRKEVKGIAAKVITVVVESGDAAPSTPIGINLPNNRWTRKINSKSVSLGNIVNSYNLAAAKSPTVDEFAYGDDVKERMRKHGALAGELHTDMHEVIGHASGQINKGVGQPSQSLKQYASALEEARADLVALYYIMDQKLVDIGVMPSLEVGMAEYDNYIMNGLITQLTRIPLGENLEEAHMRNRQLVAKWVYEHGKKDNVIEMLKKDGKTYVKINDYKKLRTLFGDLLREIQRVISEGDFKAGEALVETYGVKVDQELLKEVLERFKKLNVAPYKGFIQPKLVPVWNEDKTMKDVKIEYPTNFVEQMRDYGKNYGLLPVNN